MKKIIFSIGLMMSLISSVHPDTLFRWVDTEGNVHYGDKPQADAVKVEEKKFTAPAISDEETLSYTTRQAQHDFPVTLYIQEECGKPCLQAVDFLKKRGIPYTENSVRTKEEIESLMQSSGSNTVPILVVGRKYLNGFEAEQWNSELDVAGYPKSAPYGVKPVVKRAQPSASTIENTVPAE